MTLISMVLAVMPLLGRVRTRPMALVQLAAMEPLTPTVLRIMTLRFVPIALLIPIPNLTTWLGSGVAMAPFATVVVISLLVPPLLVPGLVGPEVVQVPIPTLARKPPVISGKSLSSRILPLPVVSPMLLVLGSLGPGRTRHPDALQGALLWML